MKFSPLYLLLSLLHHNPQAAHHHKQLLEHQRPQKHCLVALRPAPPQNAALKVPLDMQDKIDPVYPFILIIRVTSLINEHPCLLVVILSTTRSLRSLENTECTEEIQSISSALF